MKGIVLAGGSGTRLYPITKGISKQLIPIFDKPMIYYPISVLMLAGIRDILVISTSNDLPCFQRLLGDGTQFGVRFDYAVQPSPDGIAQAFVIGKDFIGDDSVSLILGDNIFHGEGLEVKLRCAVEDSEHNNKASVFTYDVKDPERFGIAEIAVDGRCLSLEEKPINPKSNHAVVGLYFYPNSVVDYSVRVKPSDRNEYEITEVNQLYLEAGNLNVQMLDKDFRWFDTGTHETLLEASVFVMNAEKEEGRKIACLEYIAYTKGWISKEQMTELAEPMKKNQYGMYLLDLAHQ